ncbi:hypothetical protein [Actinomycetospora aeridis]|uniref:Uncharacterized protein n=1 Tax=Actinomycetospora aeridis TaxID=3129231 RepID=A0ABU8N2I9_9PSEU
MTATVEHPRRCDRSRCVHGLTDVLHVGTPQVLVPADEHDTVVTVTAARADVLTRAGQAPQAPRALLAVDDATASLTAAELVEHIAHCALVLAELRAWSAPTHPGPTEGGRSGAR